MIGICSEYLMTRKLRWQTVPIGSKCTPMSFTENLLKWWNRSMSISNLIGNNRWRFTISGECDFQVCPVNPTIQVKSRDASCFKSLRALRRIKWPKIAQSFSLGLSTVSWDNFWDCDREDKLAKPEALSADSGVEAHTSLDHRQTDTSRLELVSLNDRFEGRASKGESLYCLLVYCLINTSHGMGWIAKILCKHVIDNYMKIP